MNQKALTKSAMCCISVLESEAANAFKELADHCRDQLQPIASSLVQMSVLCLRYTDTCVQASINGVLSTALRLGYTVPALRLGYNRRQPRPQDG